MNIESKSCSPLIKPLIPLRSSIHFPILYFTTSDAEHNAERLAKFHKISDEIKAKRKDESSTKQFQSSYTFNSKFLKRKR